MVRVRPALDSAQLQYVLTHERKEVFDRGMSLTPEQAEVFWGVYHQFEKEKEKLAVHGAAIGAVVGAAGGAARRRRAEQQYQASQQQARQQYEASVNGYKRAFSACMTGRGYTVS